MIHQLSKEPRESSIFQEKKYKKMKIYALKGYYYPQCCLVPHDRIDVRAGVNCLFLRP